MTTGELAKGVAIRAITAIGFGVIAYFAISYALEMVGIFGKSMGVDERSKEIYATVHQIVHIFAAACAVGIGVFHMTGNKVLRRLALAGTLLAGGYGVFNMIGFTSSNRVAVAAAKESHKAAVEREYNNARKDLQDQIKWLENQVIFADNRAEKRRMEQAVDTKRKELSALKAPRFDATSVLSDAQATTLGDLSRTGSQFWQSWLPVLLAFIVFFAESFSFAVVGHMLAAIVGLIAVYRTTEPASEPKKSDGSGGSSGGSGGGEPRRKPDLKSVPKPEPTPAPARAAGEPKSEQSSAFGVPATGAPERLERLSAFDLAYELALQNPHLSTRALVKQAGKQFSQSTASRVKKRLNGKVHLTIRKYGNGRGYQTPAYN